MHLAEITLTLKPSVKLRRFVLCGDVAACNFTEGFNISVTLARCITNSLMMVIQERNM